MPTSKNKTLLTGAITVAVLAVVLIVLGMMGPLFASHKAPPAGTGATQGVDDSVALYGQALAAQRAGDLNRAVDLARAAVTANPNNDAAKKLLADVTSASATSSSSGSSSGSSGSSSSSTSTATTTPSVNPAYFKKISDLTALVPTGFPGYDLGPALQIKRDASVTGQPKTSGTSVLNVTWSVHDRSAQTAAKSFITKTSKSAYSHNGATVTVSGTSGYFGTDGTKFATVSYVRGRYVFEVIVTATGNSPSGTKPDAVKAANAFPALPVK